MAEKVESKSPGKRRTFKKQRQRTFKNYSEVRWTSEDINNLQDLLALDPLIFKNYFSNCGENIKQAVEGMIDYSLMKERSNLQKKIDYYITPYNKDQNFQEWMEFGEKFKKWRNLGDKAKKDWKIVSNFIFNTEKHNFRSQLSQVNQDLYGSIKKLAIKLVNKRFASVPRRK